MVSGNGSSPAFFERKGALWGALVAVTLLGALVRAFRLSHPESWVDEYATYGFASEPLSRLFSADYRVETNPPLYYALQHLWMQLGSSTAFCRSLPLLFGIAAVPLLFVLGRLVLDAPTGLLGAALLATADLHIYFSRTMRAYSLLVAAALGALIFLALALREHGILGGDEPRPTPSPARRRGYWAGYGACVLLALYTHSTAVLLPALAGMLVLGLFASRRIPAASFIEFVLMNVLVLALYWPWLRIILWQDSHLMQDFWIPTLTLREAATHLMSAYACAKWCKPILYLIPVAGIVLLRRRRMELLFLLVFLVGQPYLLGLLSLRHSMFIGRVLLWPTPLACLLSAWAILQLRSRLGLAGVLGAAAVVMALQMVSTLPYYPAQIVRGEPAAFAAPLRDFRPSEDHFVIAPITDAWELWWELRELSLPRQGVGVMYTDTPGNLKDWFGVEFVRQQDLPLRLPERGRVWLMKERVPPPEAPPGCSFDGLTSVLDDWGMLQGTWRSGNTDLLLYARRP